MDVKKANIDFLVFSGLKWLAAGYGIGVLYIDRKWFDEVEYPVVRWRSGRGPLIMDNRKLDLSKEASVFEVGYPHFPNISALGGALRLLEGIGEKRVEGRIYELGVYLVDRPENLKLWIVSPLDREHRSGTTVVKMKDGDTVKVVKQLRNKNIVVSLRGKGLRISTHVYTTEDDIERLTRELGFAGKGY